MHAQDWKSSYGLFRYTSQPWHLWFRHQNDGEYVEKVIGASAGAVEGEEDTEDDAVDNSVDVMHLLGQFRDIAAHPKTRNQLIQDATSLGGLVLLLNDKNPKIVEHTLEIFLLLSKSKVYI